MAIHNFEEQIRLLNGEKVVFQEKIKDLMTGMESQTAEHNSTLSIKEKEFLKMLQGLLSKKDLCW